MSDDEVRCDCCLEFVEEGRARGFNPFHKPELDREITICDQCWHDREQLTDERTISGPSFIAFCERNGVSDDELKELDAYLFSIRINRT